MEIIKNIVLSRSQGRPILADVFYVNPAAPKPLVIYAHGFNGFKDWGNFDLIARQFASAGFVFLKFNFSHNGTSAECPEDFVDLEAFGQNNYSKELSDLSYVVEWAMSDKTVADQVDKNQVFLIGHSKGGGVVLITAAENTGIRAVATWASVAEAKTPWGSWPEEKMMEWQEKGVQYITNSRTRQELPLYYQLYLDYINNQQRLDIVAAIRRLSTPVLICHGTSDTSVPVEQALLLHKAQPASELFLVEGDHVFGRKHPWLHKSLPQAMQEVVNKTINFFLSVCED